MPISKEEHPPATVPLDGGCSSGFGARSRIRACERESGRGATESSSPTSPGWVGPPPRVRLVPLPRPGRYRRGNGTCCARGSKARIGWFDRTSPLCWTRFPATSSSSRTDGGREAATKVAVVPGTLRRCRRSTSLRRTSSCRRPERSGQRMFEITSRVSSLAPSDRPPAAGCGIDAARSSVPRHCSSPFGGGESRQRPMRQT